jgi:hypothetical protein
VSNGYDQIPKRHEKVKRCTYVSNTKLEVVRRQIAKSVAVPEYMPLYIHNRRVAHVHAPQSKKGSNSG